MTNPQNPPPAQNLLGLHQALQEQVDACDADDCEMCHRHRAILADAPYPTDSQAGPDFGSHAHEIGLAIAERLRQIETEGWTTKHDDSHAHSEMARAAAAYCLGQWELTGRVQDGKRFLPWRSLIWPWSKEWWKPKTRREDLIRAAALIIAEIQRLNRAATKEETL